MNQTKDFPKMMPPMGLLAALLLSISAHFLLSSVQILPGLWRLLGLLPLVLGLVISYAAEKQFHLTGTTVKPFKDSTDLVTDGLYRFSRNPMYLGMVLVLLGAALLLGSLAPFFILAFYIAWIHIRFIRIEEQMLSTQFGQDWLEYKAQVRRWV